MIKKRIIASATLLLPIAVTLVILSSCKDNFTDHMEAKLEIVLVSGNKSEPLTDACVKLNCMAADSIEKSVIEAKQTSDGHYETVLTAGYSPAHPFIEVGIEADTFRYSVPDICFEKGYTYRYLLTVDKNGILSPGIEITVESWEEVDVELEFN